MAGKITNIGAPNTDWVLNDPQKPGKKSSKSAATTVGDTFKNKADGGDKTPARYTIVAGDTLSEIASHFQVDVNLIKQTNNLVSDKILEGATLNIPGYRGHCVQPGDTLFALAAKYEVDPKTIQVLNKIANADHIAVDQILIIPRKSKQDPAPAPKPEPKVTTAVTTAASATKQRDPTRFLVHTLEKGETWEKVGQVYNLTADELAEVKILNAHTGPLSAGEQILIPPTGPRVKFALTGKQLHYTNPNGPSEFLGSLKSREALGVYRPGSTQAIGLIKAGTQMPKRQQALLSILGVEAKLDGVNSYDNGYLSIGFFQWTFHMGEAMQLLLRFKKDFPEDYNSLFAQRGLTVENAHTVSLFGAATNIKRHAQTKHLALLRSPYFSWVIVEAAKNVHFQQTEIAHALGRFDEAEFSSSYQTLGVNEAQLTDLELALLLNYHIQKPKIMDREISEANQERERLVAKGLIPKDGSGKDWTLAIFAVNSMQDDRREKAFSFFSKNPEAKTLMNLQHKYRAIVVQEAEERKKSANK